MRIVFMGTPEFAVPALEALLQSENQVVGVVTQPDRPKGRGGTVTPTPVKLVCQREGVPFLQPLKMKDPTFQNALIAWQADVFVVAAFGRILPQVVLDIPPRGCINVHASLLPKYRGAGPIQWAVINGETETGITTMMMDAGMDTGAMLLQERVDILPEETAGALSVRLAALGARLLLETLRQLKAGTLTPQPQDDAQATLAPLLKKEDGLLDWTRSATTLANRIRGLTPWPGAFTYLNDERLVLWSASPGAPPSGGLPAAPKPGTIVEVTKDAVFVVTGDGALKVAEVQPASGKRMTVRQYLAGHPLTAGLCFVTPAAPPTP